MDPDSPRQSPQSSLQKEKERRSTEGTRNPNFPQELFPPLSPNTEGGVVLTARRPSAGGGGVGGCMMGGDVLAVQPDYAQPGELDDDTYDYGDGVGCVLCYPVVL